MIAAGADVNMVGDGIPILHKICEHYNGILEPFLRCPDMNIELRDKDGRTPLLAACSLSKYDLDNVITGHYSMDESDQDLAYQEEAERPHRERWERTQTKLPQLLSYGVDINAVDLLGQNALHHLLKKEKVERAVCGTRRNFVAIMQQENITEIVKQKNKEGYTPLQLALTNAHFWAIDKLLAHGADPRSEIPERTRRFTLYHLGLFATRTAMLSPLPLHPVSSPFFSSNLAASTRTLSTVLIKMATHR